jgi:N-acetylneuraminic acid mutarotase
MTRIALLAALSLGAACTAAEMPAAAPWTRVAPMPTARSELAGVALDGRIFALGGIAQLGTTTVVEAYDPATGRWQELASLPEDLHHLAAAAAGGALYVTGGYTDVAFSGMSHRAYAYDPDADRWRRIADLPAPRAAHAMAAVDGRLYLVGGVGPEREALWIYDPATDRWDVSKASMPTRREHLAAVALDGKLYVVGGRWRGIGNLGTLEIYDPATDLWRAAPDMPTPRSGLTAAAGGGAIHVTGGEDLSSSHTFDQHEVYDPATRPGRPPRHCRRRVTASRRRRKASAGT